MFFIASQVTAQDVSTMIRYGQRAIIFLINNGGYTTEAAIHDGPYNVIKNWNYTGLVDALHNGEGKCWTTKVSCLTWCIRSSASIPMLRNTDNTIILYIHCFQVRCEEKLIEAIETATGDKKDNLCFIEVVVHKDDTSKELLEFGSRVFAANNSRPPNPQ